jgi:Zn-finger nucleic acid-binding protein
MEPVVVESIQVERCTACRGLWFDLREHIHLRDLPGAEQIDDGDINVGREHNKTGDILCPVDQTPMIRMVDARQPHIWYESCHVCYGVYFDAGEFADYKNHTVLDIFLDLFARQRR